MPGYLLSFEWVKILWPLLLIAGLVSVIVWTGYIRATADLRSDKAIGRKPAAGSSDAQVSSAIATTPATKGKHGKAFLVIFSFSMLGLTIGWLTGDSGQQVLASVLPAVLTLIGGLAVFLVGKQFQDSTMIAAAVTVLTFNLLVGALLASENSNLVKKQEEQALLEENRAQIQNATGLKSDADVEKLQSKIDQEQQRLKALPQQ